MEKSTAGFIGRQKKPGEKKRYGRGIIKENMQIYALMLPTLVLIFIFCYIPMYGLVIAFQDYVPGAPFLGEGVKWVGLRWFDKFISGHYFSRLIKNTLILSGLNLLFGFTAPIFSHCCWIKSSIPVLKNLSRRPAICPISFLLW